jgi:polysaccharide biosynthesis protein PelG
VAGIGFELRQVLQRGGLLRFLGVSLAGTAVVAGPWLLSVFGIFLIQRFAGLMLAESPLLFSATVVYCYAFSLVIFGGLHYSFTRQVSDLIYIEARRDAGSALISCMLFTLAVSAAVGAACVLPLRLQGVVSHPLLFMASAMVLFCAISLNWVLMSFISLLRSYTGILLVYLGSAVVSFGGVLLLGGRYATGGALLGYALGQVFAVLVLYAMTLGRFRPSAVSLNGLFAAVRHHPWLFLAGLFYAWATWAEKVVFWFVFGTRVPGSWMRVFDPYDVPIFLAILTLIPGLVYFTIETETAFYPRLREFLRAVGADSWQRIQEKKSAMIRSLVVGLREQCLLQGIVSATLILLAPMISQAIFGPGVSAVTLRLTLAAVYLHSVFLGLMVFLFYFELYDRAFLSTLAFFAVNLAVSLPMALMGDTRLLGLSYIAGGAAGCAVAGAFLSRSIRTIDRTIFIRASGTGT